MSLLCRRKFNLFLEGLFNLYCIQEIRKFRGERGATIATGWNETTGLTHLLTMLWSDQTLFLLPPLTDSLIALQSSFLIYNQAIQLDFVKVKQQRCVTAFVLFWTHDEPASLVLSKENKRLPKTQSIKIQNELHVTTQREEAEEQLKNTFLLYFNILRSIFWDIILGYIYYVCCIYHILCVQDNKWIEITPK